MKTTQSGQRLTPLGNAMAWILSAFLIGYGLHQLRPSYVRLQQFVLQQREQNAAKHQVQVPAPVVAPSLTGGSDPLPLDGSRSSIWSTMTAELPFTLSYVPPDSTGDRVLLILEGDKVVLQAPITVSRAGPDSMSLLTTEAKRLSAGATILGDTNFTFVFTGGYQIWRPYQYSGALGLVERLHFADLAELKGRVLLGQGSKEKQPWYPAGYLN